MSSSDDILWCCEDNRPPVTLPVTLMTSFREVHTPILSHDLVKASSFFLWRWPPAPDGDSVIIITMFFYQHVWTYIRVYTNSHLQIIWDMIVTSILHIWYCFLTFLFYYLFDQFKLTKLLLLCNLKESI